MIKDLNQKHYSDLEKRVTEAQSWMINCEKRVLEDASPHFVFQEKLAHKKWLELALAEENFLHLKSRVKWVGCGDCNSAYFHCMVNTRRSINQIHYLTDSSGNKFDEVHDIQAHCIDFYSGMFGSAPPPSLRKRNRPLCLIIPSDVMKP